MLKNNKQNPKSYRKENSIPGEDQHPAISKKQDALDKQSEVLKKVLHSLEGNKEGRLEQGNKKSKK